jgi:hypothetical protein
MGNTILAAFAAGVIGAGAVIGAVSLGLVPVGERSAQPRVAYLPVQEVAPAPGGGDAEVQRLNRELHALQERLDRANRDRDQMEDRLRSDIHNLQKAIEASQQRSAAAQSNSGSADTPIATGNGAISTSELDARVVQVVERMKAEEAERERQARQLERLAQLEASKLRIAESTPRMVQGMAQRWNIPETSVEAISEVVVKHLQTRAEYQSELQSARIDGREVDMDAYNRRMEELNRQANTTLSIHMPTESAESMLNMLNRTGGMWGGAMRTGEGENEGGIRNRPRRGN